MQVVYPPATERFIKRVASKDVTVKGYDKFAHDLFLDTCKDEVCGLLNDWILAHLGPGRDESAAAVESPPTDPAKL